MPENQSLPSFVLPRHGLEWARLSARPRSRGDERLSRAAVVWLRDRSGLDWPKDLFADEARGAAYLDREG
jgi:hypothetical protein